jgi:hypothetical protein
MLTGKEVCVDMEHIAELYDEKFVQGWCGEKQTTHRFAREGPR